jgi:hypothetical protein
MTPSRVSTGSIRWSSTALPHPRGIWRYRDGWTSRPRPFVLCTERGPSPCWQSPPVHLVGAPAGSGGPAMAGSRHRVRRCRTCCQNPMARQKCPRQLQSRPGPTPPETDDSDAGSVRVDALHVVPTKRFAPRTTSIMKCPYNSALFGGPRPCSAVDAAVLNVHQSG